MTMWLHLRTMKSIGKKSKRVFMSVSRKASISGWKILPNNGRLLLRGSSMTPIRTRLRFGAGIKSDMSRESGVFAVPVKPGSTENWNPRRCGIIVVRRAPRFWMPDSLCRFRIFTASEGSVSLSSVAACVILASFSRSLCTAHRRGMNAFCARSWASRVCPVCTAFVVTLCHCCVGSDKRAVFLA
jgi:hypothetical protein